MEQVKAPRFARGRAGRPNDEGGSQSVPGSAGDCGWTSAKRALSAPEQLAGDDPEKVRRRRLAFVRSSHLWTGVRFIWPESAATENRRAMAARRGGRPDHQNDNDANRASCE